MLLEGALSGSQWLTNAGGPYDLVNAMCEHCKAGWYFTATPWPLHDCIGVCTLGRDRHLGNPPPALWYRPQLEAHKARAYHEAQQRAQSQRQYPRGADRTTPA